jgi:DinB family protein
MNADFLNVTVMYNTNTNLFKRAVQGIPPERWFEQPGKDSNPLVWVAGHLVISRALALKTLGSEWSAPWEKLFDRGAKLVAPEQYPGVESIVNAWEEVSGKLSTALSGVSCETLARPISDALPVPAFRATVGGKIALLAFHETYHIGQAAFLRKWLGYGQVVG